MRDIASVVGLKVISSTEGRELGSIAQVVFDLSNGDLVGLIIDKGPSEKGIEAKDVSVIGTDAVMVETHKVARHLSEIPTLLERRRDVREGPKEVISADGNRLGALGTVYINPAEKKVSRYEVSGGAWRDITEGALSLEPGNGTVDGRDTVVVPTSLLSEKPATPGGLKAQLAKLGDVARTQARQAAEKLEESNKSVRENVTVAAGKASETVEALQQTEAGEPAEPDETDGDS